MKTYPQTAMAKPPVPSGSPGGGLRSRLAWCVAGALAANHFMMTTAAGRAFLRHMFYRTINGPAVSWATRYQQFKMFVWRSKVSIPRQRRAFLRAEGFNPPCLIAISLTGRCNLACAGCYASTAPATDELSLDAVERLVAEANTMGIYYFILVGGEPFCWPSLFALLERRRGNMFVIFTNGTLIGDAEVRRLARLGNATLAFSVEGLEASTDARRGHGVFAAITAAMARCRAAGVRFAYSVTVTRDNAEETMSDEFTHFFTRCGCTEGRYFDYMPYGRDGDMALKPTPAQRLWRYHRLRELRATAAISLYDFINDGETVGGCMAAGRHYLHVNAAGGVEPCVYLPFFTHTIIDSTLRAALHAPFFAALRALHATCGDPRRPCPITDHAAALRDILVRTGARPSHPGAERLLADFAPALDAYGICYHDLLQHPSSPSAPPQAQ